jgi:hypothetical protein
MADDLVHQLDLPSGPFNRFSSGLVDLSTLVGGSPNVFEGQLVVSLLDGEAPSPTATVGVSQVHIRLGSSTVYLEVQDGKGGLVVTEAGVAGEVTAGAASLQGVPLLTFTATNIKAQFNNTDADIGPVVVSVSDNHADDVTVHFTGPSLQNFFAISGAAEIAIGGSIGVTLGGNFAIETTNSSPFTLEVYVQELHFDLKAGSLNVFFNHARGILH